MLNNNYKWFIEASGSNKKNAHALSEAILSTTTKFQKAEILSLKTYGRVLVLDGRIQSTELDEFIYHEALVHPAMITHPRPEKVAIIGGGEGATLREVLKHNCVKEVIMIDIDEEVVNFCKEHLPTFHQNSFSDPRTKLIYTDARKYFEETKEIFDVIIIDISEPLIDSPAYLLFTKEFYQIIRNRLEEDGIISVQSGTTNLMEINLYLCLYKTIHSVFSHLHTYETFVPCYATPWSFITASNKYHPGELNEEIVAERLLQRNITNLRFYDEITHRILSSIPKHIRDLLNKTEGKIILDNNPVYAWE
ncbi:MAG: polyamine aminopropyltransferase [bacterium]|nr:polyamine aminopropyltransferase [bacterium]